MRFYEVAPNLIMTEHAITIRPICFASQTLARLPPALQEAVKRAGREAGAFGREAESSEDGQKIAALETAGRLRRVAFNDRAALKRAVDPVMEAYAKEVGAESIFTRINALTS
jgi:TRAP-type C4-dicarboxylate transport system substrate-binding protein